MPKTLIYTLHCAVHGLVVPPSPVQTLRAASADPPVNRKMARFIKQARLCLQIPVEAATSIANRCAQAHRSIVPIEYSASCETGSCTTKTVTQAEAMFEFTTSKPISRSLIVFNRIRRKPQSEKLNHVPNKSMLCLIKGGKYVVSLLHDEQRSRFQTLLGSRTRACLAVPFTKKCSCDSSNL